MPGLFQTEDYARVVTRLGHKSAPEGEIERRDDHAGASGPFSILRFRERDLPDVVYTEQLTSAVYLDQRADVEHYLKVADQVRRRSG